MCIVIDTNTFSHVFNDKDTKHSEFKPVYDWLFEGDGKFVFGGTKYKKELKNSAKLLLKSLRELERKGKYININDKEIDRVQNKIEKILAKTDCDDPHIIAIFIVSKCRLLCTEDKGLQKYIKNRSAFQKDMKFPDVKIYSKKKNQHLLCDKYIINLCKN